MKIGQAVEVYLRDQPIVDRINKDLDTAKKVIKAHCAAKSLTVYRGIGYSTTTSSRLDTAKARAALGPTKAAECTVESVRESLTLPAHLRRGAVELDS